MNRRRRSEGYNCRVNIRKDMVNHLSCHRGKARELKFNNYNVCLKSTIIMFCFGTSLLSYEIYTLTYMKVENEFEL